MTTTTRVPISDRGWYPRPQLMRPDRWWSLDGPWQFAYDDESVGLARRWFRDGAPFDRTIVVPFPPESPASGIGDTGPHAVLWYRRTFTAPVGQSAGARLLLHLGAVDHEADVWVDGQHVVHHEGGQTPITIDVTDALDPEDGPDAHVVVVRAQDDIDDIEQPRGKQDWRPDPHVIWYHRTSGIWRSVWLEEVPAVSVDTLVWRTDVPQGRVSVQVRLRGRPAGATRCRVHLTHDGVDLASGEVAVTGEVVELTLTLQALRNGQAYEELLWSPASPALLAADVDLVDGAGTTLDAVQSYCGMRSVSTSGDVMLLNDRPFYLRAVLEQGYWPESHLAPPSAEALRDEVELIRSLGFNGVRIHQKVEDPRFLFWCDVLGVAVWAETAGAYRFSDEAVTQLTREWLNVVRRDLSHPCIIAWVPFNESWGVQHLTHDPAQQAFTRALAQLTRALDPTRLVISNDGWEHTDSDLWTVHDYTESGAVLRGRYRGAEELRATLDGVGPAGRHMWVGGPAPEHGTIPVVLSEFGGVSLAPDEGDGSWGYTQVGDRDQFAAHLTDLLDGVRDCLPLSGYCYTQLTDTGLETNGLCDEYRKPKLPVEALRHLFREE